MMGLVLIVAGGSRAEGLGSGMMRMEVMSSGLSGLGWSSDGAGITGWAGTAVGRAPACWEALGAAKMGWGATASPQRAGEGLGAALHPLLRRCQPRQNAEGAGSTHTVLGRGVGSRLSPSCWGCHCALGPVGWHAGVTHPKCVGLGHLLCSHCFPCFRMCGGETRAEASRDEEGAGGSWGRGAAGYQSAPIPGVSPYHSPACAALLGTGCGVSVPQFPQVPGDAAPQALPALCSLAGGVG